jgi:pimeloyl-ACP methyl ester carboxylesterase
MTLCPLKEAGFVQLIGAPANAAHQSWSAEPPPGASIAMEQDWEASGPEAARDILLKTRDEDLRPFLPKVTPPALVIHMKGDRIVPFEAARWLAESLPNGVLEEFDAPREIPFRGHAELAEHIEEFLRVAQRP